MFRILKAIALGILAVTITGPPDSAAAEQISVTSTFSCSTNDECKRKCEALGPGHVWKPNPGGSTLGTCTKHVSISRPSREAIETLGAISANSAAIEKELKEHLSNSPTLRRLGIDSVELGSFSILLKGRAENERICASCRGSGITVELCCPRSNPNCFDPCREGEPIVIMAPDP